MNQKFFWGSATASHQVEGGTTNDWSEWEKRNADRLAREAKTKWEPWQREKFPEMFLSENYISGKACDHYHRYEEDFDLAREGGHNAHRFSIEWARVEPEEGKFDEAELQHYVRVVQALRARGLEPFVTLWHWTLPVWLAEKGGLLAKDFPELFLRYAEKVTDALGNSVTFYMTVNEPNSIIVNGYLRGIWLPQKKNLFLMFRAYRSLAEAHVKAYDAIKKKFPASSVGFTELFSGFFPRKKTSPFDCFAVRIFWRFGNEQFVSRVAGSYDFLGVQNYFSFDVGILGEKKKNNVRSDMGWELRGETPETILRSCSRYGVPLYVTEDGCADAELDDEKRCRYLHQRTASLRRAVQSGVNVCGYFHWSLLDNFEWDKGFWPRFGLVFVDRKTFKRIPRKSFLEYKKIIEAA